MIFLFNVLCITKRIPRTRSSENYCYAIVPPIRSPSLAIFVITLPFSPPPTHTHNKANFYRLHSITTVPSANSRLLRHINTCQLVHNSLTFCHIRRSSYRANMISVVELSLVMLVRFQACGIIMNSYLLLRTNGILWKFLFCSNLAVFVAREIYPNTFTYFVSKFFYAGSRCLPARHQKLTLSEFSAFHRRYS